MGFLYETHLHTSEVSRCAVSSGEEMARAFKEYGYTGIIVTDHFFNGNTTIDANIKWEEKVEQLCSGYENAKKTGDKIGLSVFFGWEYNYKSTEFLTYGLDKKWLLDNPDLLDWSLDEYFERVKQSGGMLIHAHPFREAEYIHKIRLYPDRVDGVETINTHNFDNAYNIKAIEYAKEYNLPQTCGTDAHAANVTNLGGMIFEHPLADIFDFIDRVKSGKNYTLKV